MVMSFRTRSFVLGLVIASITWGIVLYLYVTLVQTISSEAPTISHGSSHYKAERLPFRRNSYKTVNDLSYEDKKRIDSRPNKSYKLKYSRYWKNAISKNELPGESDIGLSKNENNFAELGLVKTNEDQNVRDEGYRLHAFNILISSRLSLHRKIPDTRHDKCKSIKYPHELPDASIIICFYREAISVLLRSIHSILDRSPKNLLKEIVLIDDTDDPTYHNGLKGNVLGISDKIILLKTPRREGLIRARLQGAREATGQVLVFLDSHIEVNKAWLEPLLIRINEKQSNVVTPIIDVISADTFMYTASSLVRGGFNWGLHFKWDNIPITYFSEKANFIKPIRSATMAGGLFAIDAKYFKIIGEYDSGMDVWGAENLELSFRVWMCGGSLEIIPCSRVGHIFRKRRPYGDKTGEDSMLKNSLRLAHVWLDNYIENFYEVRPEARNTPYGDVSERKDLRKRLNCKSFRWYIDNIYPNIMNKTLSAADSMPMNGKKYERWDKRTRNYEKKCQIRLSNTDLCIESEEEVTKKGSLLTLSECAALPRQIFYKTDKNELILAKLLCLEASSKATRMAKCHDMSGNQEWKFNDKLQNGIALYNIAIGLCLSAAEIRSGAYINMAMCSTPELASWDLVNVS